ncbi:MAG: leucine-rich repeat domain-containing protein, partial [Bacteroidota bacterium]
NHLEDLSLQNNQLQEFPKTLSNLKQLRFLDLSYNQLSRLSGSFNYPFLEKIDLTLNDLSLFPFVPATLPRIRFIGLAGNKIDVREKIRVESIFVKSGAIVQW